MLCDSGTKILHKNEARWLSGLCLELLSRKCLGQHSSPGPVFNYTMGQGSSTQSRSGSLAQFPALIPIWAQLWLMFLSGLKAIFPLSESITVEDTEAALESGSCHVPAFWAL